MSLRSMISAPRILLSLILSSGSSFLGSLFIGSLCFAQGANPGLAEGANKGLAEGSNQASEVVQASDLTGVWKVEMSFGNRGRWVTILKLDHRDNHLSGVMVSNQGSETAISAATLDQNQLAFDLTRRWGDREFTSHYAGTLVDGQIEGTAEFEFRSRSFVRNWVARRTTAEPTTKPPTAAAVAADIDLSDANYEEWREHIIPSAGDLAWEQIPWLTTFKDGILTANANDKPLLFWTMNGHPLGCT